MSLTETLILVLYFFVLSILAIYGWHRYYLVYLYMKNKGNVPPPLPPPTVLPRVTIQLPIFNEMYVADRLIDAVCEIDYPRELLEIQVLDDSTDETTRNCRAGGAPPCRARVRHQVPPPRRSHGLQGGRARSRPARGRRASSSRFSTPTSCRRTDFLMRTLPLLRARSEGRHGAGALGSPQPRLLAADADPVDPARRALRARARRAQPRRLLLQFQRHRGRLAARGDRRRRRLAARHADRGSRSELPRAAARAGGSSSCPISSRRPKCRSR